MIEVGRSTGPRRVRSQSLRRCCVVMVRHCLVAIRARAGEIRPRSVLIRRIAWLRYGPAGGGYVFRFCLTSGHSAGRADTHMRHRHYSLTPRRNDAMLRPSFLNQNDGSPLLKPFIKTRGYKFNSYWQVERTRRGDSPLSPGFQLGIFRQHAHAGGGISVSRHAATTPRRERTRARRREFP